MKRILSLALITFSFLAAQAVSDQPLNLTVLADLYGGASCVLLVHDSISNQDYVFKQNRDAGLAVYRDAIMEYTWSKVAKLLDIVTNDVYLISPDIVFEGKPHPDMLGTLHSYLHASPGYKGPYSDINMKGRFTNRTFQNLIQHIDLARIAALDLVSGNPDRHSGNLMYDKINHRYIAIDFGYASRAELAGPAYIYLKTLLQQDDSLQKKLSSKNQFIALQVFISTLESIVILIDNYTILDTMREGLEIAQKYGLDVDTANLLVELFNNKLMHARSKAIKIAALIKKRLATFEQPRTDRWHFNQQAFYQIDESSIT